MIAEIIKTGSTPSGRLAVSRSLTGAVHLGLVSAAALVGVLAATRPGLAMAGVGLLIAAALVTRARELVLIALPFSLLAPVSFLLYRGTGPNLTLERATVIGAAIATLGLWALRARAKPRVGPHVPRNIQWPFALFTAYVFAVAVAVPSSAALHQAFSITLGAAVPAILVLLTVDERHDLETLARAIAGLGSVAALLGIVEAVGGHHLVAQAPGMIFYTSDRAGHLRAQSIFPHPIVFGLVLALVMPITLALWMRARRTVFLCGFVLQVIALLLTFSRGPWFGAAAGLAAMAAVGGRRGARHLLLVAAVVVVLAASPLGGPVTSAARALVHPQTSADVSTVKYRQQLLHASWAYMSRHPAGSNLDPGQSPALIRDVNGHSVDVSVSVDNAYLKYGLAIGVVGVALMMLVLIGILVTARRAARSDSSDALPAALFGAVTTMIVVSATVATFTWEQAGVLFSIIVGMVMAYAVYPGSESERDDVVASG